MTPSPTQADDAAAFAAARARAQRSAEAAALAWTPAPDALGGRVVAITGAGSGYGEAVARAAAQAGADVILVGRNVRELERVHAAIEAGRSGAASIAVLDLERALARDYDTLGAALLGRYGRLDGLVHAAAQLGALAPLDQFTMANWCRVLHVNLTAPFALTQVLLPALRQSADASIVFTSCAEGRQARAYYGAYGVTKFAVEGLAQTLAMEVEQSGRMRVNTVDPGPARTRLRRLAFPAEDATGLPVPAARVRIFLWLLSVASRGVNGLALDGADAS